MIKLDIDDIYIDSLKINDEKGYLKGFELLKNLSDERDSNKKMVEELIQEKINELNEWLEYKNKPINESIILLENKLLDFYKSKEEDGSNKRLSTPWGQINRRTNNKISYDDEDMIKYLESTGGRAIKKSLNRQEVNKLCAGGIYHDTGEVLPFVKVEKVKTYSVRTY